MSESHQPQRPDEVERTAETEAAPAEAVVEGTAGERAPGDEEAEPVDELSQKPADAADAGEAEEPAEEAAAETGEAEPAEASEAAGQPELPAVLASDDERLALLEAIIYIAEDPLTADQIAGGLALPREIVEADLNRLVEQYAAAQRGIEVRKVAGGYKMYTKAEHHEAVRVFVKTLHPKLKLSKPAFETLAVIAYKQPITVPEIQAIRGVNASGTLHTLLKHKLITSAGRKKVIGKPMMYKTTREFLVQFGLDDLAELPNLKEFEELSRAALGDEEPEEMPEETPDEQAAAAAAETGDGAAVLEAQLEAIEEAAAEKAAAEEEAAGAEQEVSGTERQP